MATIQALLPCTVVLTEFSLYRHLVEPDRRIPRAIHIRA